MSLMKLKKRFGEFKSKHRGQHSSTIDHGSPYGEHLQTERIRLITIQRNAGTLRLRITPHKFKDDLEYDAISYVWGTAEASVNVSCNGKNLAVTPSVFEMLHYLDPSRSYWLDSLCINQQDAEEKAVQIPLMHRIYSQATFVVIWIGILSKQSERFMVELPSALEKARKWNSMLEQNLLPWLHEPSLLVTDKHFWQGLIHLLKHDWFKRLWTFQETVLAKCLIMLHGSLWIRFDGLLEFLCNDLAGPSPYISTARHVAQVHDFPAGAWKNLATLKLYRASTISTGAVLSKRIPFLLHSIRSRQVKEPVDRAWAVVGLFNEDLRSKLDRLVDYSDKGRTDFLRTHTLFAKAIITAEHSLALLTIPPTIEGRPRVVPSWLPALEGTEECFMMITGSWTEPVSGQIYEMLLEEAEDERNQPLPPGASNQLSSLHASRKFISFRKGDDFLQTHGYVVDTISEVVDDPELRGRLSYIESTNISTHHISNPTHAANVHLYTRSLILAHRTAHRTNHDVDTIWPEYLMTLLCDTRICREATTAYEDAWTLFIDQEHTDFEGLSFERQRRATLFYQRLLNLTGHSFFSTVGGRFGVAHPGCKSGDKVCVFYDEHPLHILRWPKPESGTEAIDGDMPAEFCGIAFIPHLMKPHEQEAARLGPDEVFVIG